MRDSIRTAIIGFVSGVVGAVIVLWIGASEETSGPEQSQGVFDKSELLARVAALEERAQSNPLATLSPELPEVAAERPTRAGPPVSPPDSSISPEDRMSQYFMKQQARTADKLRAAGWSDFDINSLEDSKNTAGLEMEERLYDQMRVALEENPQALAFLGPPNTLLNTLGEEKYEQYLEATGKPTAIKVNNLLKGSVGEAAGLQKGDMIRRYGPDRVFGEQDLMKSVLDGEPGEPVTIEIERDGAIIHVTVPRGPLGTSQIARMIVQ